MLDIMIKGDLLYEVIVEPYLGDGERTRIAKRDEFYEAAARARTARAPNGDADLNDDSTRFPF